MNEILENVNKIWNFKIVYKLWEQNLEFRNIFEMREHFSILPKNSEHDGYLQQVLCVICNCGVCTFYVFLLLM